MRLWLYRGQTYWPMPRSIERADAVGLGVSMPLDPSLEDRHSIMLNVHPGEVGPCESLDTMTNWVGRSTFVMGFWLGGSMSLPKTVVLIPYSIEERGTP